VGQVARRAAVERVNLKTGRQPRIDTNYRSYLVYKYREFQKTYADVKRYHKREYEKYLGSKHRTSRPDWKRIWAADHVPKYADLSPEIIQLFASENPPSPSEAARRELQKKSGYSLQTLDRYVLRRTSPKRRAQV
jgi:hypothetical protein